MRITYDPEVDALYIALREGVADDSMDVEDGVTVDLDAGGHILGVEVLDARRRGVGLDSFVVEQLRAGRDEHAVAAAR